MRKWVLAAIVLARTVPAVAQQAAPPQQQPPAGTQGPAQPPTPQPPVVIERTPPPNPLGTVAMDAAYGGAAGFLVGFGVALVNEFDGWGRDLMVGAGAGVLIGAAVGVVQAAVEARDRERGRERYGDAGGPLARPPASDGMNRTDRDPVITGRALGFAVRF